MPLVTAERSLMAPKGSGRKEKRAQNTNIGADAKIHYDEANGHLKMGSYTKALCGYSLVSAKCECRELLKKLTVNQLMKELIKFYYRVNKITLKE
jgi:hypothetical protein